MKRFKGIVLAALAVLVATAYLPTLPASAQEAKSAALGIAPKKNYLLEPGESIKDTLSIRNVDTSSDLQLNLRVIDFTYTDDTGTPKLMLDQDAEPTTWSLRSYMDVPERVTIKAGETASPEMNVKMPANIGAGSYYSAIIYSTGAPDGGNVGLSASGVTLVFVTVPGKVNEDLKITKLGAYNPNKTKGDGYMYIASSLQPRYIGYTLENKGNVTEAPVGTIKLKNRFFGMEYNIADINPTKSLALIGQTRTIAACIKLDNSESASNSAGRCTDSGIWPGLYTVSIDAFYGQNGNLTKELTKTSHFWYLPLWFIVLVIVLILAIVLGIWRLRIAMRERTKKPRGRKSSMMRR